MIDAHRISAPRTNTPSPRRYKFDPFFPLATCGQGGVCCATMSQYDLLITNTMLYDGTGGDAAAADIGIVSDRIATVARAGTLTRAAAAQHIDATGLSTAPGFIDAHAHSDTYLLVHPEATSKITQGVTTEINGQCGGSAAPLEDGVALPSDWEAVGWPGKWKSVAEYRAALEHANPAVNTLLFAGHNTLRKGVVGFAPRAATPEEVALMARRLEAALDDGAAGLSTGLLYPPGMHAAEEEIDALARVAARHGGCYATHMRSEGDGLLESLDEVLALAGRTGVSVQLSHLKTSGAQNAWKLEPALERIHAAQARGCEVYADRYPYLAAGTDLDVVLPDWAGGGGRDAILARLADTADAARLVAELDASERDWGAVMVGATWHASLLATRGRTIAQIAAAWQRSPGATVVEILQRDETRTGAFFFGMNEANLKQIYREPYVMPGSDASIRSIGGPLGGDHPHPRAFGTFPRFFRLVTHMENPLTSGEAIRRMTSLPAQAFGLRDRGVVREGAFADLVVFAPENFRDTADYATPHRFAKGVSHVIVNGILTLDGGKFTGNRGGTFLAGRGKAGG